MLTNNLCSNAPTIKEVFEHCVSDACVDHACYIVMQEASSAQVTSINPTDHRKLADRRHGRAKLWEGTANVTSGGGMQDEQTEQGSDSHDDTDKEMMQRFSHLDVDDIYGAAAKVCRMIRHYVPHAHSVAVWCPL
jgi:hypothetical protein